MSNPFERGGNTATAANPTAPVNPTAPTNPSNAGAMGNIGAVQSDDPYSMAVPVGLSGMKMSDPGLLGQLLLVEPLEHVPSIVTRNGTTDAFRVNILPLTGPLAEKLQANVTVWQEALKRELMTTFTGPNRWLVADLQMGEAKGGNNAPYLFNPPNADQMAIVEAFKARQRAAAQQQ